MKNSCSQGSNSLWIWYFLYTLILKLKLWRCILTLKWWQVLAICGQLMPKKGLDRIYPCGQLALTIITSKAARVTLEVRHKGNKSMVKGSSDIEISCKWFSLYWIFSMAAIHHCKLSSHHNFNLDIMLLDSRWLWCEMTRNSTQGESMNNFLFHMFEKSVRTENCTNLIN